MTETKRTYRDIDPFRRIALLGHPLWGHPRSTFLISLLAAPLELLIPPPLKIEVYSVLSNAPLSPVVRAAGVNFEVPFCSIVADNPARGKGS